jgi:hypothetical protein
VICSEDVLRNAIEEVSIRLLELNTPLGNFDALIDAVENLLRTLAAYQICRNS